MSRTRRAFLLNAAALLAIVDVRAQSFPFTAAYEGNNLPQSALTTPQWIKAIDSDPAGPNTSESVSNGILTIFTASKADYLEYQMPGGAGQAWSPSGAGSTLEVRLKTDFNTAGASLAGNLVIATGNRGWTLAIGENQITDLSGGGSYLTNTKDGFHTYRFTIADEVNGALAMYIDGARFPAKIWQGTSSTANRISFGDTTSSYEGGQIQWDYIRWSNQGKYAPSARLSSGQADFGRQWLREHPLTLMGEMINTTPGGFAVTPFDTNKYLGLNMNTVFSFQSTDTVAASAKAGIPWQMATNVALGAQLTQQDKYNINNLISRGHATGWYLPDEPSTQSQLQAAADYARWMNANHPDLPLTINVFQNDLSFLNNVVTTVKPDVLMFDNYPFSSNGSTDTNTWFSTLMNVRQVSQANRISYGGWLQSFHAAGWNVRTPSESDTRFNAYTMLTAGYTELSYYIYDNGPTTGVTSTFFDSNGNPTAIYTYTAAANKEYETVGKTLRFLTSTDVRFVPGLHTVSGSTTAANSVPTGLSNWTVNAGADPHLLNVSVASGQLGLDKNGLIGFFTDDDGQNYFMLTNLNHAAGLTAAGASLNYNLTFDNSINEILRLNRVTGAQELLTLTNHQIAWNLPGGTGDLFKYNIGNFYGFGWCMDASGDWNNAQNWSEAIPNGVDAKAVFAKTITAARTVYADTPITVGTLRFENTNTIQIAGTGTLSIDVSSGTGSIAVLGGTQKINIPLFLKDNTVANIAAGAALKISNPMTLAGGATLTKTGSGTLSIEAPAYTTAASSVVSAAGVMSVSSDLGRDISLTVSGGTTTLNSTQHVASLNVTGGVLQLPTDGGAVVSTSLSIAGDGQVDLQNSKLILNYSAESPFAGLLAAIKSGKLMSSALRPGTTIASGEASDLFGGQPGVFSGEIVDSTTLLFAVTMIGDPTLDGAVDSADFNLLVRNYGLSSDARWTQGDFDGDGRVSTLDFNILAGNFGNRMPSAASLGSLIPEPTSGALVGFAVAGGFARRRAR